VPDRPHRSGRLNALAAALAARIGNARLERVRVEGADDLVSQVARESRDADFRRALRPAHPRFPSARSLRLEMGIASKEGRREAVEIVEGGLGDAFAIGQV